MSIPWRELIYGWLVCALFAAMAWSVWYSRCGWSDDRADFDDPLTVPAEWSEAQPRFDGDAWVPEGWTP